MGESFLKVSNSQSVKGVKLFGNELTKDSQNKVNVNFGMKLFGNTISPDANNIFNLNWENFALHEGNFTPVLIGGLGGQDPGPSYSPSCTYYFQNGYFIKFASFCYINIRIKCSIESVYSGGTTNASIGGLDFFDTYGFVPRTNIGAHEYSLSTGEITVNNGGGTMPSIGTMGVSSKIFPGGKTISILKNNGASSIQLGTVIISGPNDGFWYSGSGIFPTSDT